MQHPRCAIAEGRGGGRFAVLASCAAGAAVVCASGGCKDRNARDAAVIVYCSVDEVFGRQVLDVFQSESGVRLEVLFDTEAGKTTGLVQRIRLERGHPRADVLWSSELFHTIQLARDGLLEAYDPPTATDIADRYRDPQRRWTAFGLRGRVLAFDPSRTPAEKVPSDWHSVAKPEVASQLAYANPLFGTTRGHVAAMFALWGPDRAASFLAALRDHGARMVDGNSAAVRELLARRVEFAATDTDDVMLANERGGRLEMRYLDLGDGGTLLIPNSVGVVAGARHGEEARRLVDFLVSARVEEMLARSASRNIPVRIALREKLGVALPPQTNLSYAQIEDVMDSAAATAREILIR